MDHATAERLTALTSEFYAQVAESFSAARQSAWAGWGRVAELCGIAELSEPRVADVACGNMRFERFLAETGVAAQVRAVDLCDALSAGAYINNVSISYERLDIVATLAHEGALERVVGTSRFDLAVCFGFMHHLPLLEQRERLLRALANCARPGGFVAVSFWQLSKSERLLAKAKATTERAGAGLGLDGLGPGDYLLGWQERDDVFRYCHDFSEDEIDGLAAAVSPTAREIARFSADGATGNLNRYLILQA